MPPASETIIVTTQQSHCAIGICNPERRNAVSLAMWQAIAEAVTTADSDPAVHLITLRGHEGTFVSGADISEFEETRSTPERAASYEAANGAAFAALRNARTPTLALIEGFCFGGGVGLAAACDLRIAASTARFAIPAAKLGLAYPMEGVRDLVRLIGPSATKRLFFTADPMDAPAALRIGFIEDMADEADFQSSADTLVATILSRAPLTLIAAKSAIAASYDPTVANIAQADARACFASEDFREGRQAFLEKRTAKFQGT
jgi:enoyl-CoA hydratase/carnithine racemase